MINVVLSPDNDVVVALLWRITHHHNSVDIMMDEQLLWEFWDKIVCQKSCLIEDQFTLIGPIIFKTVRHKKLPKFIKVCLKVIFTCAFHVHFWPRVKACMSEIAMHYRINRFAPFQLDPCEIAGLLRRFRVACSEMQARNAQQPSCVLHSSHSCGTPIHTLKK